MGGRDIAKHREVLGSQAIDKTKIRFFKHLQTPAIFEVSVLERKYAKWLYLKLTCWLRRELQAEMGCAKTSCLYVSFLQNAHVTGTFPWRFLHSLASSRYRRYAYFPNMEWIIFTFLHHFTTSIWEMCPGAHSSSASQSCSCQKCATWLSRLCPHLGLFPRFLNGWVWHDHN